MATARCDRQRVFPQKLLVVPALVLALRMASAPTADVSYLVLAVWALTGRAQAIQALFMCWLITMLNAGLAPEVSLGAVGRYLVIFGAMISLLLHTKGKSDGTIRNNSLTIATLLLGIFLVFHSAFVSPYPDVSILKSISFVIAFVTLLSAWSSLTPLERVRTEICVFGGMLAIVFVSLPFILGGVGYLRNNTGFQGILNQPNAFGPFAGVLAAWLAARFMSKWKMPLWQMGVLGLSLIMIFASESRGGAGAFVLGIALPFIYMFLFKAEKIGNMFPGILTERFALVVLGGVIGCVALASVLHSGFDHFISKSGRAPSAGLAQTLESSRGGLVEKMYGNIKEKPITGIGFGIASFPENMIINSDPILGLPIGASIEKGVMPVAVVEELGIPGSLLVGGWFLMLFRSAVRNGYIAFAVVLTALMTNLGESTFFSVGGLGLIMMILVTWAVTLRRLDPRIWMPEWIS